MVCLKTKNTFPRKKETFLRKFFLDLIKNAPDKKSSRFYFPVFFTFAPMSYLNFYYSVY